MELCIALLVMLIGGVSALRGESPETPELLPVHRVDIRCWDGVRLRGEVVVPIFRHEGERFPVLLYPTSWAAPKWEYLLSQVRDAFSRYLTLAYTPRGWWFSGGLVDIGGYLDRKDITSIVDWVLTNYDGVVNASAVGMLGISYGAVQSVLGAAFEPRIKAVVAMSGAFDLRFALYPQSSVNMVVGTMLMDSGRSPIGHLPQYTEEFWKNLKASVNVSGILQWALEHSAAGFLQEINARKTPVMLSSNFQDRLFRPDQALRFYEGLTGPKRLDLNLGIHGSYEVEQMLKLWHRSLWPLVQQWFDHFLKGMDNGVEKRSPVSFEMRNVHDSRVSFPSWPTDRVVRHGLLLGCRGAAKAGTLSPLPRSFPTTAAPDVLENCTDILPHVVHTGMTAGLPVLGDMFQTYVDIPVTADFHKLPHNGTVIYVLATAPPDDMDIVGDPVLNVWVVSDTSQFQLDVYLYDLPPSSHRGVLITDGTISSRNATVGEAILLRVQLRALAYRLHAGHRLVLGLNTFCDLYDHVNQEPHQLRVVYKGVDPPAALEIPATAESSTWRF
eukprot:RCo049932